MSGATRNRTRRKPWFRLAILAASIGSTSLEQTAKRVSWLSKEVSRHPVSDFMSQDFSIFARRTLAIKDFDAVSLRCELLFFRRTPGNALWLARTLRRERFVARVDRVAGTYVVLAEVLAPTRAEVDAIVERFEPDERLLLESRHDFLRRALAANAAALAT